jgi:hypothetical protein
MVIEIKTEHFKNAPNFSNIYSCPLALAIHDIYSDSIVNVGGYTVNINNKKYNIGEGWDYSIYAPLMEMVQSGKEIPTVIVKLTEIK